MTANTVRRVENTVDTRNSKYLTGFAGWPCTVALDLWGACQRSRHHVEELHHLSLATALAIHSLSRLVRDPARRQAVDTDLRSRHCGCQ
jgi:hypothetical protein